MGFSREENSEEREKLGYLHMGFVNKNDLNGPLTKVDYYDYVDDDIGEIKKTILDTDFNVLFTSHKPNIRCGFIYRKNGQNIAKVILEADTEGGKTKDGSRYQKANLTIYDIRQPNKEVPFARIKGIAGNDLCYGVPSPVRLDGRYTDWIVANIQLMEKHQQDFPSETYKNEKGEQEIILHRAIPLVETDEKECFLTFNKKEKKIKRYVVYSKTGNIVKPQKDITKLVNTLALPFSTGAVGGDAELDYKDGIRHISIEYDEGKQKPEWYAASEKNKPLEPYWASLDECMQIYKKCKIPHNLLKDLQPGQYNKFRISNNFCINPFNNQTINGQHYDYGLGNIPEECYRNLGYIKGDDVIFDYVNTKKLEQDGAMIAEGEEGECILQEKIIHFPHEWKKIKREFRKDYSGKLCNYVELDTGVEVKDKNNGKIYKLCYVDHESSGAYFKFKDEAGNFATIKDKNNNNNTLGHDNNNLMRIIANKDEEWINNKYYFYCLRPYGKWNGDSDYAFGMSVPVEDQRPYDDVNFFNNLLMNFLKSEFPDFEVSQNLEIIPKPKKKPYFNKLENDSKKPKNNDENDVIEKLPEQKPPALQEDEVNKIILENHNLERENKNIENNDQDGQREQTNHSGGNPLKTKSDNKKKSDTIANKTLPTSLTTTPIYSRPSGQASFFQLPSLNDEKTKFNNSNLMSRSNKNLSITTPNDKPNAFNPTQNTNNANNNNNIPSTVHSNGKQQTQKKSSYAITIFAGTGALAGTVVAIIMRDKKIAVIIGSATAVFSALVAIISGVSTYTTNSKIDENRKMNNNVNNNLGNGNPAKQI